MRSHLPLLIFVAVLCVAVGRTSPPGMRIADGVTYEHIIRDNPPLHLHVARIDLTNPAVHVVVARADDGPDQSPAQTRLQTVRTVAQRHGLDIAVNGGFFTAHGMTDVGGRAVRYYSGNAATGLGLIKTAQSTSSVGTSAGSLVVDEGGRVSLRKLQQIPADARYVVSGDPWLVWEGQTFWKEMVDPAPRTGVGLSADGRTLFIVVLDGRRAGYSAGLSHREMGEQLIGLGCHTAINLDGGGSSTMVIRNPATGEYQLMSRPSDGHDLGIPLSIERPVANVLGVRIDREMPGAR